MYFYKNGGKLHLDLTGNLIFSHNDQLVKKRSGSQGPYKVKNATYAIQCSQLSFKNKIVATLAAISFIWGKSTALTPKKAGVLGNNDNDQGS